MRKVGELFVNGGMFPLFQENLGKFFQDGKMSPRDVQKNPQMKEFLLKFVKENFSKLGKKFLLFKERNSVKFSLFAPRMFLYMRKKYLQLFILVLISLHHNSGNFQTQLTNATVKVKPFSS